MSTSPARPSALLRLVFALPPALYHWHLGRLAGYRLLLLTYRGRRTRRPFRTALEVIGYDHSTGESVVISGYGATSGWYLSIRSAPATRVQTGALDYVPCQRFLEQVEARQVAELFCREHPLEARFVPRVLAMMSAPGVDAAQSPIEAMASLPMVAFRPPERRPRHRLRDGRGAAEGADDRGRPTAPLKCAESGPANGPDT